MTAYSVLDSSPEACSVLDMRYLPECKKRNHMDRHADKVACDLYEAEDRAAMVIECTEEVAGHRHTLTLLRQDIKEVEADLARSIQEALKYGASPTKLARAAGLSRERIYQIRDGRR